MIKRLKNRYAALPIPVRASLFFLISSFTQKGISMLTTPIFTRLFTPEEFGKYNVFNSWLSIATIIVTLSLTAGVYSQGLVKFEKEREVFSSSLIGLTTVMILGWCGIY